MAIGKITSPTTWVPGTVAAATWFQNAQDTLNALQGGLIGIDYALFREEFLGQRLASTSSNQLFGQFITTTLLGTTEWNIEGSGTSTGAFGVLQVICSANSQSRVDSAQMGVGDGDFYFRARVRVDNRANLATAGGPGFALVLHNPSVMFACGNDSTVWNVIINGVQTSLAGATVTSGTYHTLDMSRLSGTITATVDGTLRHTVVYPGSLLTSPIRIFQETTGLGGATIRTDYVCMLAPRSNP